MQMARRRWWANKWYVPAFALALGIVLWVAQWVGGDPRSGAEMFAIMGVTGLIFLLGGRSETIRGLRGDGRDERFTLLDLKATAIAGMVVITCVIVGFVVELARGEDGNPYGLLGAAGGLTYVIAVLVLRFRS
jgi:hypothetical protein